MIVLWTPEQWLNLHLLFHRVIKPEEGKKLADSWGAAFMESSAKENEVSRFYTRVVLCLLGIELG